MKLFRSFLTIALSLFIFSSCNSESRGDEAGEKQSEEEQPREEPVGDVHVYTTKADKSKLFEETTSDFGNRASMSLSRVDLDPSTTYQTMVGFGPAITGASCYNLLKMSSAERTAFLKSVFDIKEGLGVSLVRCSIGASDFSVFEEFTWCDTEGIENFSVAEEDKEMLFPILHEIYAINPDLKIIGSPWSCPKWMKMGLDGKGTHDAWTSGRLNPKYYGDYAAYFVKWIQTMEKEGFDIYAVTLQNEPLNKGNSMSLYMPWEDQRDFLKVVGPAFEKAGIDTKILLFDHNYNYDGIAGQKGYPIYIFNDPEAGKYAAGSAWHNYGGLVTELDNIVAAAPDKEIFFTESSIGAWGYDFESNVLNDFESIYFQTFERGGKGVTVWNFVLDENCKPYRPGGCSQCYGAVTLSSKTNLITDYNSHYYNFAHASKVIKQGAVRIGASGYTASNLYYQAYKNPDGSYGVITLNKSTDARQLVFVDSEHSVKCTVPAKAIVSLIWKD